MSARLRALREERQLTRDRLARETAVSEAWIHRAEMQWEPAPNHPFLLRIAKAFGMPLEELTKGTTAAPLPPGYVKQVESMNLAANVRNGRQKPRQSPPQRSHWQEAAIRRQRQEREKRKQKPGTAVVLHRPAALTKRERAKEERDARLAARLERGEAKQRRNALKRVDARARQVARGLAEKVNIARMTGARYVHLDVPLPTDALMLLLQDYFELKGIRKRVLIEADFGDIFA